MKFQIELKDKSQDYKDAVKNRLEELGWKIYNDKAMTHKYVIFKHGTCIGINSIEGEQITLNDLYNEPEKYRYKKKERVEWFRVTSHLKELGVPIVSNHLHKSREHFLENREESDYHFIHLEKICEHEYERNN